MMPGRGEQRRRTPVAIVLITLVAATGLGVVLAMLSLAGVLLLPVLPVTAAEAAQGGLASIVAFTAIGAMAVVVIRYLFLHSVVGWGLLLGAFLWVPFGNHILALRPEIEALYPTLRPRLDRQIGAHPTLTRIRASAEARIPPPAAVADGPSPAREVGRLAAPSPSSRLPQISE